MVLLQTIEKPGGRGATRSGWPQGWVVEAARSWGAAGVPPGRRRHDRTYLAGAAGVGLANFAG